MFLFVRNMAVIGFDLLAQSRNKLAVTTLSLQPFVILVVRCVLEPVMFVFWNISVSFLDDESKSVAIWYQYDFVK